jgi:hypothetical protein
MRGRFHFCKMVIFAYARFIPWIAFDCRPKLFLPNGFNAASIQAFSQRAAIQGNAEGQLVL